MIKKLTLICLLITIGMQLKAQQGWTSQKIDDKVSIAFPIAAKKLNENSYGIRDNDGIVYISTTLNLAKITNLSVEQFTTNVATQEFADEFLKGMAPQMPNFNFGEVKITTLKGLPVYKIVGRDNTNKTTMYMAIIFKNGISYNLSCILPDGKSETNKDIFLASISVEK